MLLIKQNKRTFNPAGELAGQSNASLVNGKIKISSAAV
jgi:hypothetical protein